MVDFTGTPANDDKSLKYDDDREIVLKVNPEYERLVPKPTPEEYTALRESIQRDGQRDDIIVNEDLIVLDGHQRNRACLELGIKTKFKIGRFPNKLEEERFVIESNVLRRHLNLFQKAEAGLALLEIERQLARKRQGERSGGRKSSGPAMSPHPTPACRVLCPHRSMLTTARVI